ncbi:MAG: Zn-dependent protease [Pseudomonadota bacterium]
MAIARRVFLFIAVNLLVVLTISVTMSVLGIAPYLSARGIDYQSLAIFCLMWGMGGAFISLALSRVLAKWMMRVQVIDPKKPGSTALARIHQKVQHFATMANLPAMPEVGIYDSPEINAFATGPTKSRALVAVSTGLLHSMNDEEVDGVIAHEVAHIANGDMVTMTLVQGVVNAFAMFLSRIAAWTISQGVREEMRGTVNLIATIAFDFLLSFLGSIGVAAFSRYREFRADADGARLAGRGKMIAALEALRRNADLRGRGEREEAPEAIAAFQISPTRNRVLSLFSTHPPLEVRIDRLRRAL